MEELIAAMMKPETYDEKVESIRLIQTHISWVFLTGNFAYKIKKPVNFGFADFSTLEKRKFFCDKELELNRRLCKDIYLEVVPITKSNDEIKIKGEGKTIDYAVKMRELPAECKMDRLLEKNEIDKKIIGELAKIISNFHSKAETNERISRYGSIENIKYVWDENFAQIVDFIGKTIDQNQFDFIKQKVNSFIESNKELFEKRISEGKIKDCHGDLHSGNIFVADKIYIFDCIEFNERYRCSDVILDIAFLTMDLDFHGVQELSNYFVEQYFSFSNNSELFKLLNFYECWRAYVRGKVISFKLNDSNIGEKEKDESEELAKKYFNLSYRYAAKF
jgi:aminoglycoside phosphotransferase family enzyme